MNTRHASTSMFVNTIIIYIKISIHSESRYNWTVLECFNHFSFAINSYISCCFSMFRQWATVVTCCFAVLFKRIWSIFYAWRWDHTGLLKVHLNFFRISTVTTEALVITGNYLTVRIVNMCIWLVINTFFVTKSSSRRNSPATSTWTLIAYKIKTNFILFQSV